jgi:hypothetical protein
VTSSIPIAKGVVESRGQKEQTDGNGGYLLRNVPVTLGENVSVGVTYVRPTWTCRSGAEPGRRRYYPRPHEH